jgi:hypothetical protein
MNTNKLKPYAQQARRDFIAAVSRRAARFGLSAKGASPNREEGELVIIEGQAYPRAVGAQRQRLAERIRRDGFEAVMEAVAYTWFNRLLAIRYMELHGYLDHSYRVLSHPAANGSSSALPEILEQAQHVDLPGLDRERVIALKLDGTQDETSTASCCSPSAGRCTGPCRSCSRPWTTRPSCCCRSACCTPTPSFAPWCSASRRRTGSRSRSSAGCTSSTSRRRRTRSSARSSKARTSPPPPSSSRPTGSSSTWCRTAWAPNGRQALRRRQCSTASTDSATRMRSSHASSVSLSAASTRSRTLSLGGPNLRSIRRSTAVASPRRWPWSRP